MDNSKDSELTSEEIAVIGMTGRFPKSNNLTQFWQNLSQGVECVSFFTPEELLDAGVDQSVIDLPNFVKARAIIDDPAMFDASFFNMNPREAELTDPQHRVFLECAWEALETAGCDPARYDGLIGVYAGADINSYALNNLTFATIFLPALLGNDKDYLATRVCFKLNLRGPGITIQTACSTSLASVHMACQDLLNYQCDMALAGGVGINFPQKAGYIYEEGAVLSPDGHCRAFDIDAKGTPGGDGAGIVVLKRLQEAIDERDYIHAVIKGSAINNDGAMKVAFTAPGIDGQAEVIAMAQAAANVLPQTIGYVETHGTGTELGDPIELTALTEAFRAGTDKKQFCPIGSLKSNVGHMNSASGVGGLIKTILALKHAKIPPSLHFKEPNPKLNIGESPFFVNTELRDWKRGATPRRAGVSSFGAGGTNVHAIVEEAPVPEQSGPSRSAQLLVLSAKTESALETATSNLTQYLKDNNNESLANIAYTLQTGRQLFNHRRMAVCSDMNDALSVFRNKTPGRLFTTNVNSGKSSLVFMFPGQGAQYVNMARELYEREETFKEELDRCSKILEATMGDDLGELLYPREESLPTSLDHTSLAQPAIFSVEYSMARLWISWGIIPDAMIGHSIGELTAACLAGVFSLEDALSLAALRGKVMQQMEPGAMIAVPFSEEEARKYRDLSIAAVNAPNRCVLSGTNDAIGKLCEQLSEKSVPCQKLHTSHAFHSQMMVPAADEFRKYVEKTALNAPQIPYISNCTGTWISAEEAMDPNYWARHICQTVRFGDGITLLLEDRARVFLEVGPGQTLSSLVKMNSPEAKQRSIFHSLRHPKEDLSDTRLLLETLGHLYCSGVEVDWKAFYSSETRRKIQLPTYPFERDLFWFDPGKQFRDSFDAPERAAASAVSLKKAGISDWLYMATWKRGLPVGFQNSESSSERCCLILTKEEGLSSKMVEKLNQRMGDLILLTPGDGFYKISENRYSIDPLSRQNYEELFRELIIDERMPEHIIHMWDQAGNHASSKQTKSAFPVFYSLLSLAGALGKYSLSNPVKIDVISSRMFDITGKEEISPEKSMVTGACRVIPQEYEKINCRTIDVEIPEAEQEREYVAEQLVAEILSESGESTVAFRGKHRWVELFEPISTNMESHDSKSLKDGGVYLITGGLGNIGLTLGKYLAKSVRARLVLTGKTGMPPRDEWDSWLRSHEVWNKISRRISRIREMEAAGSQVLVFSADATDEKRMAEVIAQTEQRFGPLNGVIHAAGVVGEDAFCAVSDLTSDRCMEHFQPKIEALYTLERIIPRNIDFCILISSISTVIGGIGLAAYASANCFMDSFAHSRNGREGVHWISINWDRWHHGEEKSLDNRVNELLTQAAVLPDEGEEVFQHILSLPPLAQVVVSVTDLGESIDRWINLDPMRGAGHKISDPASRHARPNLDNEYVAPRNETEEILAGLWGELLGIEPIGVYDNFFQLGGDSLVAIQLATRLRERFFIEVSVNNLFDEPTISNLAEKIVILKQSGQGGVSDISEKLEMIESMSDEEVKKMLEEMNE